MIRVVADTNVVVSAFIGMAKDFQEAYPRRIFQAIEELEEVMNRPHVAKRHRKNPDEVAQDINRFSRLCEFVINEEPVNVVEDDPDDNVFLAIAKSGHADFIISGDPHLLDLQEFEGIPIITPKRFVDTFLKPD
jgi:putative PIN family toxin of toxin-antitoxin system